MCLGPSDFQARSCFFFVGWFLHPRWFAQPRKRQLGDAGKRGSQTWQHHEWSQTRSRYEKRHNQLNTTRTPGPSPQPPAHRDLASRAVQVEGQGAGGLTSGEHRMGGAGGRVREEREAGAQLPFDPNSVVGLPMHTPREEIIAQHHPAARIQRSPAWTVSALRCFGCWLLLLLLLSLVWCVSGDAGIVPPNPVAGVPCAQADTH